MIYKNIVRSCKRDGNANYSEKRGFLNRRKVSFSQEADWLPRLKLARYWLVKAAPCFFCYVSQNISLLFAQILRIKSFGKLNLHDY